MKAITASLLLAFVQLALAHPGAHYESLERDQAVFEAAKATAESGRVNEPAPSTQTWLEKYGPQVDLGYTVCYSVVIIRKDKLTRSCRVLCLSAIPSMHVVCKNPNRHSTLPFSGCRLTRQYV